MGCFNLAGFYSHLPIKCGDRIGAIVCVVNNFPNSGCIIGATGLGYHPVCSPIYGTYNDYGGIDDVEDTLSARIFEKATRVPLDTFAEMNHRNTTVSLNSVDNGNEFDDIPAYQEVMRPLIAEAACLTGDEENISLENMLNDRITYEIVEEQEKLLNDYKRKRVASYTIHIIYEHYDILKTLEKIGEKTFRESFEIGYASISRVHDNLVMLSNRLGSMSSEDDSANKAASQLKTDLCNNINDGTRYEYRILSLGCCNKDVNDAYLLIKDIEKFLSDDEYKKAYQEIFFISHSVYLNGSYFCPSAYNGQEIYAKELLEISSAIKVMSDKIYSDNYFTEE